MKIHLIIGTATFLLMTGYVAQAQETRVSPNEGSSQYVLVAFHTPADQPLESGTNDTGAGDVSYCDAIDASCGNSLTSPNSQSAPENNCFVKNRFGNGDFNAFNSCACTDRDLAHFNWGGHIQAGVLGNANGDSSTFGNGPLGVRANPHFNLNQAWIWAGRKAHNCGNGVDWGWRADAVFGTDFVKLNSHGSNRYISGVNGSYTGDWDSTWDNGDYGLAIPQLYAELAVNRWTIKGGHFLSPIGYESAMATGETSHFYSHSYNSFYGIPTTMSGIIAESSFYNGRWTAFGGWINGWNNGLDSEYDDAMFIGGLKWQATHHLSIKYGFIGGKLEQGVGSGNFRADGSDLTFAAEDVMRYTHSVVAEMRLTERLRAATEGVYGYNHGRTFTPSLTAVEAEPAWYGISQYLIYDINCKWSLAGRFEWFHDGVDQVDYNSRSGFDETTDFYALTAGVTWRPTENLKIRPELRYDWTNDVNAFASGTKDHQLAGGFDFVYQFR